TLYQSAHQANITPILCHKRIFYLDRTFSLFFIPRYIHFISQTPPQKKTSLPLHTVPDKPVKNKRLPHDNFCFPVFQKMTFFPDNKNMPIWK
ncbi:hypothetical protein, partial [Escherichia coli]